jgi:hypothetical protein
MDKIKNGCNGRLRISPDALKLGGTMEGKIFHAAMLQPVRL